MMPNNNKKRSIRDIGLEREHEPVALDTDTDTPPTPSPLPPRPRRLRSERTWQRFWVWTIGALLLVVVVGIVFSFARSGATIAITPRTEEVTVSSEVEAKKNARVGELPFIVQTQTHTESEMVATTGEEEVVAQATGKLTIQNNFDESPQRLIANTRFESPEGLIYRISDAVVVPGQSTNENGELVPGEIEVTVTADAPGEEYNIGPSEFTIPGFKEGNDPRFFSFSGVSREPMIGGFSGVRQVVAEADEIAAREALTERLEGQLQQESMGAADLGTILFPETSTFTYSTSVEPAEEEGMAKLSVEGTLHTIGFSRAALAEHIARTAL